MFCKKFEECEVGLRAAFERSIKAGNEAETAALQNVAFDSIELSLRAEFSRRAPRAFGPTTRFLRAHLPVALPEVAPFNNVGTQGAE